MVHVDINLMLGYSVIGKDVNRDFFRLNAVRQTVERLGHN
jgi:hypothetical protein